MILLSAKEGAFERPKTLMGGRQLPRLGQFRLGDAHHDHGPLEVAWGQRSQPFAAEAPAFWAWRSRQRGTCNRDFVVGVVRAREFAVELKLCGSMIPFLIPFL
jgi:hypothetical protein